MMNETKAKNAMNTTHATSSATFTERQADMLAALVAAERHRAGGTPWGPAGIKAALRQVAHLDLIDVTAAFLRAARTTNLRTPAVAAMPGPHWNTTTSTTTPLPPRRTDDCPHHPGNWATNCHGCAADQLTGTTTKTGQPATDLATHVAAARAAIRHNAAQTHQDAARATQTTSGIESDQPPVSTP